MYYDLQFSNNEICVLNNGTWRFCSTLSDKEILQIVAVVGPGDEDYSFYHENIEDKREGRFK